MALYKMGGDTTNTISSNQTVVNTMLQASKARCSATCKNTISGVTIIVIGSEGEIGNISQECKMNNINCIMQNSFNVQIENILKSMIDQSTSAMSGISFDWKHIEQNVNLYQLIENTITQTMDTSCTFEAGNEATGLYFYVQDSKGKIGNLSQSSSITNASCNMDNMAKAVTYNEETSDAKQKATVSNMFALIFIAIIIAIIMAGIVLVVFLLTGGVASVAKASSQGGLPGGINPADVSSILSKNPELLALV